MTMYGFNLNGFRGDPRFVRLSTRLGGRSSWVWRVSAMLAGVVVIVPAVVMMLALLAAGLTFFIAFTILSMIDSAITSLRSGFSSERRDEEGRQNVRVIRQDP